MDLHTLLLVVMAFIVGVLLMDKYARKEREQVFSERPAPPAPAGDGKEYTLLLLNADGSVAHEIHSRSLDSVPTHFRYGDVVYVHTGKSGPRRDNVYEYRVPHA